MLAVYAVFTGISLVHRENFVHVYVMYEIQIITDCVFEYFYETQASCKHFLEALLDKQACKKRRGVSSPRCVAEPKATSLLNIWCLFHQFENNKMVWFQFQIHLTHPVI